MTSLLRLDVSYNQLSGKIPFDFFGDSTEGGSMTVFRATSNNFVGQLPTQLGMMQKLNILALGTCWKKWDCFVTVDTTLKNLNSPTMPISSSTRFVFLLLQMTMVWMGPYRQKLDLCHDFKYWI